MRQHLKAAEAHEDVAHAHVEAAEHFDKGEIAEGYQASAKAHLKSKDAHIETDKAHNESAARHRVASRPPK
jgi:hypothetical protein